MIILTGIITALFSTTAKTTFISNLFITASLFITKASLFDSLANFIFALAPSKTKPSKLSALNLTGKVLVNLSPLGIAANKVAFKVLLATSTS